MEARAHPLTLPATVVAAAWSLAVVVQATGRAGAWHHDALLAGGMSGASVAAFLAVWQLHIGAVMLPSSLPTLARFARVVTGRPRPALLQAAFLGGYATVWTAFGALALLLDGLVHRTVEWWPWLAARPGLLPGAVLVGAGLFQLSGLKERCLHVCRRPDTFLRLYYRRGTASASVLGIRHGLFCLGCCWALMLVMVAVGIGNLAWMAPLALVMVVEKTVRGASRIVRPVGWALIGVGLLTLAAM